MILFYSQTRPDICTAGIKHLRWRTSATLQIAKPVNQSELSRDSDNIPNRLHIWDFHVVMLSVALLCTSMLVVYVFFWLLHTLLKGLWWIAVMKSYNHILLFCDFTYLTFAVFIILEGLSNVYCCCYAWTQNFGTEATLASAVEANFAPYI